MKLQGKTAVVTGAGAGMGKAIAILFAEEGANVIAADINEGSVNEVAKEITDKGGKVKAVVANMASQEDIDRMMNAAVEEFGSVDVLVNNAGIMDNFKTVDEVDDELWDRIISVNLTGPFKAARAALRIMNGQENGGVIINNASVGGLFGSRGGAAYVASKHGLIGLTKNIAATHGTFGKVRANAIAPGGVKTNIGNTITDPSPLGYKALAAAGGEGAPMGESVEIARLALFLASDDSSFVNGAIITADGGWTSR